MDGWGGWMIRQRLEPKGIHSSQVPRTHQPHFSLLFPSHRLPREDKEGNGIPIKGHGHMVKRSGPLGPCFLEVVRPPHQPGSSSGWGCGGYCPWSPHMSNAKQQEVSLSNASQVAPIWAVCAHIRTGGGQQRIPVCVLGQGHSQAVTICCPVKRLGQGLAPLKSKPSTFPGLVGFAELLVIIGPSFSVPTNRGSALPSYGGWGQDSPTVVTVVKSSVTQPMLLPCSLLQLWSWWSCSGSVSLNLQD